MQPEPSSNAFRTVFDNAVELSSDQRDRFLADACAGDMKLRAAVESLLAAHDRAGTFLADPLVPPDLLHAREQLSAGTRVGRYVLLRILGEGGYGTVHLAEQDPPLRRHVALKVIRPGMDSRQVIARFELERQALAMMDHPNIAKVFDAGSTSSGHPYFVMELVDGLPITQFCRSHALDIQARLRLFMTTCNAVHHAHKKGVIHRDLKPGNVLVALQDGLPMPKVIDFGIAKALIPDADAAAARATDALTLQPQFLGTPQYMSPEQALAGSGAIDWRTDVYSLGALLYELLADVPPFDRGQLQAAAYMEIGRVLREVDPPLPSARLAEKQILPPNVAPGQADARKHLPQVRGDLDRIVMKAMQKDPTRRYESAAALTADVQRHLDGQPVSAPNPIWHQRRRQMSSRRFLILAILMLIASITTAVVWERSHRRALASQVIDGLLLPGLTAELYTGRFEALSSTRIDKHISFYWPKGEAPAPNLNPLHFSILWRGVLLVPPGGITGIGAYAKGGMRIDVDGRQLVSFGKLSRVISHTALSAGRHKIEVRYWNHSGPGAASLLWLTTSDDADAKLVPVEALFHEGALGS